MTDSATWPVALKGVVESVVTTEQPDGDWNLAPLGLHPIDGEHRERRVRARTWGRTRTAKNFERTGRGMIHFDLEPITFVNAALTHETRSSATVPEAAAVVDVRVDRLETGRSGGTGWTDWLLTPTAVSVHRETIPVTRRASVAVVELTIALSRTGVQTYDDAVLQDRATYFADVIERCGGPAELAALERIEAVTDWSRSESGDPAKVNLS